MRLIARLLIILISLGILGLSPFYLPSDDKSDDLEDTIGAEETASEPGDTPDAPDESDPDTAEPVKEPVKAAEPEPPAKPKTELTPTQSKVKEAIGGGMVEQGLKTRDRVKELNEQKQQQMDELEGF